jgi:hypothetical protein
MSKQGVAVAESLGKRLPSFAGSAEAETSLYAKRDRAFTELSDVSALEGQLDYSPESLDRLEQWFFSNGQPERLQTGFNVADAIGFYVGEVYCRNAGFSWVVREFVFMRGRYEIGVSRGSLTVMLTTGIVPPTTNNKRMRYLRRTFDRYRPT